MAENRSYNDSPTFIPARLESSVHSSIPGNGNKGPVADAKDIYDINHGKWQKDINNDIETVPAEIERIDNELGNRYTKSETYNKEEVYSKDEVYPKTQVYNKEEVYTKEETLALATEQDYVAVEATDQTTSATDVLPVTGAANTIYRVGNWDGSQYDTSYYSEYAWSTVGNEYKLLHVNNNGIDTEPKAISKNFTESAGINDKIQASDIYVNGVNDNLNEGFLHPSGNSFVSSGGYGFVYKVHSGDTLKVKAAAKDCYFALLKENVYKTGVLSKSDASPNFYIVTHGTESSEITIPNDCNYILFGINESTTSYAFPKEVYINGFDVTKTIYGNIQGVIDRVVPLEKETAAFGNAEFIDTFVGGKRLSATIGQTVDVQNPTTASGWEYAIITCSSGDKFSISAYGGSTNFFAWATLDTNKKVLRTSAPNIVEDELVTIADGETSILIQNRTNLYKSACFKGVSKDTQLNKKIQDLEWLPSDFVSNGLYVRKDLASYEKYNINIPNDLNPVWTVAGNSECVIIPLSDVVKVLLKNNSDRELVYAFLTNDSHTEGQAVALSEANKRRQGVAAGGSAELEVPSDATYLYIGVSNSSGVYFGNQYGVYFAEDGKVIELDKRISRLEQKENWNLDSMTYGVDNEAYTFWTYPGLIHTNSYRNKLIWSWCDNMGYTGAGEYDLNSKVIKRRLLKKSDIDDHNMASVTELADGRIVFGYAGGHGYDNKEHFRITKNKEYVDNVEDEVTVDLVIPTATVPNLGPTTYNQTLKIGDTYYIFCRVNRIGWAYFTTKDFVTFTTPVHFLVSPDPGYQYYCKVAKVTDNSNLIRIAMYANASEDAYTEIRMGYLNTSNGKFYNAYYSSPISSLLPIECTEFTEVVPTNSDEQSQKTVRLFDLLESGLNDAVIAFARMPKTGNVNSGTYRVCHVIRTENAGNPPTITINSSESEVDSCGVEWISSRAPGGITFINGTKIIMSKGIDVGYWKISIWEFSNNSWTETKVIYSEDTREKTLKIVNKSPILSTDKKYLMWLRGWYKTYKPSLNFPVPFEMNLKMYDIDNDEILF